MSCSQNLFLSEIGNAALLDLSTDNVTSPIQDISTHGDTRYRKLFGGVDSVSIEATCGSLHGNRSEVVLVLRRTSLIQVNMSLHPVLYGEN